MAGFLLYVAIGFAGVLALAAFGPYAILAGIVVFIVVRSRRPR